MIPRVLVNGLLQADWFEPIAVHVNGLPFTAEGSLAVAVDATVDHVHNGIPFDADGRVCVEEGSASYHLAGRAYTASNRLLVDIFGTQASALAGLPLTSSGALAVEMFASATFALDFQNDEYFGLSEAVTFSSPTGGVAVQDYQGNFHITEAGEIPVKGGRRLKNFLASTAALSTQGVTVQDTDYFLSFKGTGSVAVSGVATDSLAGTGASDRVSKKITMGSAGTATFTVTGTVTDAYLYKARPGQTEPDPEYISNGVPIGLLDEQVTNGDFSDGLTGWTISGGTGAIVGGALVVTSTGAGTVYATQTLALSATGTHYVVAEHDRTANFYATGPFTGYINSIPNGAATRALADASVGATFFFTASGAGETMTIGRFSVKEIRYHGHNIDGLAWLKTDPDGNDLTDPASGYAVLRTGVPRWPQITNLLRYSDDVSNAAWSKSEITVTANSEGGPLPSQLDALTPSTNATTHNFLQSSSATATGYYTASAYAKANGYNFLSFRLDRSLAGAYVCFNLSDGTISQAAGIAAGSDWANASATITHVGGGVYRCTLTAEKTGAANAVRFIGWVGNANMTSDSGVSFAGDGTSGVAVGGLQLEAGDVAHAYVPTTSASVTASPLLITPDKDAIGWPTAGGTWVIAHTAEHPTTHAVNLQTLLSLFTDSSNRILLYNQSNNVGPYVQDGGVAQWLSNTPAAAWTPGTEQLIALRVIEDDGSLVTDGVERLTDTSMTLPAITNIWVGGDSSSKYEGVISQIAFYAES